VASAPQQPPVRTTTAPLALHLSWCQRSLLCRGSPPQNTGSRTPIGALDS
jgi:hypothetical protein